MKATAIDARDDTMATAGTLVAMTIIMLFDINIDAYVALFHFWLLFLDLKFC